MPVYNSCRVEFSQFSTEPMQIYQGENRDENLQDVAADIDVRARIHDYGGCSQCADADFQI
jgi:hypothetical protein